MDHRRITRRMKRILDDSNNPPSKRSKFNTILLTDLIDDCLIPILGFLDLQSLFNLVLASLIPIAQSIFRRKFSKKTVIIKASTSLHFIRSFGAEFTKVKMHGHWLDKHSDMMDKFLN